MFTANARSYLRPQRPTAVVCLQGADPELLAQAVAQGRMPWLARTLASGTALMARGVLPSAALANQVAILTGVAPDQHGLWGERFLDPESGALRPLDDPRLLRATTVLAAAHEAGVATAVVVPQQRLGRLLAHGLPAGALWSADQQAVSAAVQAVQAVHTPQEPRDPRHGNAAAHAAASAAGELALNDWVFDTALALLAGDAVPRRGTATAGPAAAFRATNMAAPADAVQAGAARPALLYLATDDTALHRHAPGSDAAQLVLAQLDAGLAQLDELGVVLAITADHGMAAKTGLDGRAALIDLQARLDAWLGEEGCRVLLPEHPPADRRQGPLHAGAFSGLATVHLQAVPPGGPGQGLQLARPRVHLTTLMQRLAALPGIEAVLPRALAARELELPEDRIGDFVVLADRGSAFGQAAAGLPASAAPTGLRSHGGRGEQRVPLVLNRRVDGLDATHRWRNFDAFDLALNLAR